MNACEKLRNMLSAIESIRCKKSGADKACVCTIESTDESIELKPSSIAECIMKAVGGYTDEDIKSLEEHPAPIMMMYGDDKISFHTELDDESDIFGMRPQRGGYAGGTMHCEFGEYDKFGVTLKCTEQGKPIKYEY